MNQRLFRDGDEVQLKKRDPCEDFPDGLPEERGEVLSWDEPSNTYVVCVDKKYRKPDDHDGLRECSPEHLELETSVLEKMAVDICDEMSGSLDSWYDDMFDEHHGTATEEDFRWVLDAAEQALNKLRDDLIDSCRLQAQRSIDKPLTDEERMAKMKAKIEKLKAELKAQGVQLPEDMLPPDAPKPNKNEGGEII